MFTLTDHDLENLEQSEKFLITFNNTIQGKESLDDGEGMPTSATAKSNRCRLHQHFQISI